MQAPRIAPPIPPQATSMEGRSADINCPLMVFQGTREQRRKPKPPDGLPWYQGTKDSFSTPLLFSHYCMLYLLLQNLKRLESPWRVAVRNVSKQFHTFNWNQVSEKRFVCVMLKYKWHLSKLRRHLGHGRICRRRMQ